MRPILSDSGPISSIEQENPMANRLTDRAIWVVEVWKCSARAGKEGSTTSRGKTPSKVMVISQKTKSGFSACVIAFDMREPRFHERGEDRVCATESQSLGQYDIS